MKSNIKIILSVIFFLAAIPSNAQNIAATKTVNFDYTAVNDTVTTINSRVIRPALRLDPSLYTQKFGFFCRKELQLEKATSVKFRFRLGSIQQCDLLEGKEKAITSRQ